MSREVVVVRGDLAAGVTSSVTPLTAGINSNGGMAMGRDGTIWWHAAPFGNGGPFGTLDLRTNQTTLIGRVQDQVPGAILGVGALDVTAEGNVWILANDGAALTQDTTGRAILYSPTGQVLQSVAFDDLEAAVPTGAIARPDGTLLLGGTSERVFTVLDPETGTLTHVGGYERSLGALRELTTYRGKTYALFSLDGFTQAAVYEIDLETFDPTLVSTFDISDFDQTLTDLGGGFVIIPGPITVALLGPASLVAARRRR